jgi:DNA-directed RNA polymerase beta' subunit
MNTFKIQKVEFKILSAATIRAKSACLVSSSHLLKNNQPAENSVYDPRLGATQKINCSTCFHPYEHCPGHWGHIELCSPILNCYYLDTVLKCLRCVCYFCSSLLSDKQNEGLTGGFKERLKKIKCFRICKECSSPQPMYSKLSMRIKTQWKDLPQGTDPSILALSNVDFTQHRAFLILKHVAYEDKQYLGFRNINLEDFFFQAFPVLPLSVRPSVFIGRKIGHEELTITYQEICKLNKQLSECNGDKAILIDQLTNAIYGLLLRDTHPKKKNCGRSTQRKSIYEILTGKDGQIRKRLMGKRVFQCSRSVIGPQDQDDIDVLGVPEEVCLELSKKIRVSKYNIDELKKRLLNDPSTLQGAKRIIIGKNKIINLRNASRHARENIVLRCGMIVGRPLQDGDVIVFNRQPSLHKYSMISFKIRVDKGSKTFKLPLAATGAFNADFDGDEMNLFNPRGMETEAELRYMMNVESLIISSAKNKPIIAACQNTIIGAYLLSRKDTFFTRDEVFQVFACLRRPHKLIYETHPAILLPFRLWTGKQILSCLLPDDLYMKKKVRNAPKRVSCMDTEERLVHIEQGTLLAGQLCKATCGPVEGGIVQSICRYSSGGGEAGRRMAMHFISDLQRVTDNYLTGHGNSISLGDFRTTFSVQEQIENTIEDLAARANRATTESGTFQITQRVLSVAGKHAWDSLERHNSFRDCVLSGTKGGASNVAQVTSALGQQAVGGKRIDLQGRSLPMFKHPTLASKGLIVNSYMNGLSPTEFFFHAMSGREGIADTSCKTADSGYINRRLVKSLEDLVVQYDYSVRGANGEIVQFVYGYNRLAPESVETVQFEFIFKDPCLKETYGEYAAEVRTKLLHQQFSTVSFEPRIRLAINPHKLWMTRQQWGGELTDIRNVPDDAIVLFTIVSLGQMLYPVEFIDALNHRSEMAWVDPGEAVGALAGTSIGEPVSQSTLNTFHFCGIASKNVTMGVPRISELLQVTTKPKTPTVTVFLDFPATECVATKMAKAMKYVVMEEVLESLEYTDGDLEDEVEEQERMFQDMKGPALTVRLDKARMEELGMGPMVVVVAVEALDPTLHVYSSVPYMSDWLVRIRGGTYLGELKNSLGSIPIQGVSKHITGALFRTETCSIVQDGRLASQEEYIFETDGTDLMQLFIMEGIDHTRTFSNCVHDMHGALGIEGARNALLRELRRAFAFDGTYINETHLELLVDQMCMKGSLKPISRHGLARAKGNLLQSVSFEEPVPGIIKGALNNEVDTCGGVTASIMLGQRGRYGTGFVNIVTPEGVVCQEQQEEEQQQTRPKKNSNLLLPSNDWLTPFPIRYQSEQQWEEGLDDEDDIFGFSGSDSEDSVQPFLTNELQQDFDRPMTTFHPDTPHNEDWSALTPLSEEDSDDGGHSPLYQPW